MVHKNIEDIDIPQYVWQKQPPLKRLKRNLAFDSETENGKAFLFFNSDGDNVNEGNNFKRPVATQPDNPLHGLLSFLQDRKFTKSVNWLYNLDYDSSAIFKFLSFKDRQHLQSFDYVDCEGFRIQRIPRKQLKISKLKYDEKNNSLKPIDSVSYFDLAQFYDFTPLKVLAKETNYDKVYVDDISHVNIDKYYSDPEYNKLWNDRCLIDCKITVELANKLTSIIQRLVGVNIYKSKASIARRYVLENISHSLKLPSPLIMDASLKAFHAGHIEACALGSFDRVKYYDINGAYPNQIANLYETNAGVLRNKEYEPDTAYSFYEIEVDYQDNFISPVWYNKSGNNYHVTGKCVTWVTQSEIEFFINRGYDVKILDARHIKKNHLTEKPFENIINDLHKLRLEAKEKDDKIQGVIKTITNSIFGATLNAINKKVISDEEETDLYALIDGDMVFYTKEYIAGNLYNPVYGSVICANNRIKIFNDFKNHYKDILSINTDGVYLKSKVNLPVSTRLGDYSFDQLDRIVFMGNGRYMGMDDANVIDNKRSCFRSIGLKPDVIAEKIRDAPNGKGLKLSKESPVKFGESVKQAQYYNLTVSKFPIQDFRLIDSLNEFREVHKHVYFKTERRYWFNEPVFNNEIWDNQFTSRPFDMKEVL